MIDSIYFRDPNGYVIELTGKKAEVTAAAIWTRPKRRPRQSLEAWQRDKVGA